MKLMKIKLHTRFGLELIPKSAKVTELLSYILNFIELCMFLNLHTVTHLSLRINVYLNDKVTLFFVLFFVFVYFLVVGGEGGGRGWNHNTIKQSVI